MNFKTKLIENFDKVVGCMNVGKGGYSEDILCTVTFDALVDVLGLKNLNRGNIIVLCNAWESLTKALPKSGSKCLYNKITSSGCISNAELGYNNINLGFVCDIDVFNYTNCKFKVVCMVGGHLGSDINVYSKKIYGTLINSKEYEAYFEEKEHLVNFLNCLAFGCRRVTNYDCVIGTKVKLDTLKRIDESATIVDFNGLADALKGAYLEIIDADELLNVVQANIFEAESKDGKLDNFTVVYTMLNDEKVLDIEVRKRFY